VLACGMRSVPLVALPALLLACGPEKTSGATGEGGGSTTSSGSTSSGSSSSEGELTSSGLGGQLPCLDNLSSEVMACIEPQGTAAYWTLSPLDAAGTIDEACSIAAVVDSGDTQTLSLDCPAFDRELELTSSSPHLPVAVRVGTEVTLQYTEAGGPGHGRGYFSLRDGATDALLVAGINAASEVVDLDPLHIVLRSSACSRGVGSCKVGQRGAVEVTLADTDAVALVFDGNFAELGGFRILVGRATREDCYSTNPECNPSYPTWGIEALFTRVE
jgi:hypothetical protein